MIAEQIQLERDAPEGLVQQLFVRIRALIEEGGVAAGARLPTSRQLASDLSVGRNTVLSAYELLTAEGYLLSDGRRGTFVSDASRGFQTDGVVSVSNAPQSVRLSQSAERLIAIGRRDQLTPRTFQPGLPEVRHFPHDMWGRCLRRAARHMHQDPDMGGYANYHGLQALRRAIIDHVATSRGVRAQPDQVVVFSSAQAAMDLVTRMLLEAGDLALHEEPGYAGMLAALRGVAADVQPILVEDAQAYRNLDAGVAGVAKPRLIYATPSHQFPTSRVMALEDRLALLAFAAERGAFVLEDDYDSEFHFSNAPLSCLQGLDRHDLVIYMGTFAKSLMPSLRVAYLVVPERLAEPTRRMQRNMGSVPGLTIQFALADFLINGHFRNHVRDMNRLYVERRDCLYSLLHEQCGAWLEPSRPEGGIQMPVYFRDTLQNVSDQTLVAMLAEKGLESAPLSSLYWSGQARPRSGLFLGFAASDEAEIGKGVAIIRSCLAALKA